MRKFELEFSELDDLIHKNKIMLRLISLNSSRPHSVISNLQQNLAKSMNKSKKSLLECSSNSANFEKLKVNVNVSKELGFSVFSAYVALLLGQDI